MAQWLVLRCRKVTPCCCASRWCEMHHLGGASALQGSSHLSCIFCTKTSVDLQRYLTTYAQCGEGNEHTGCKVPAVLRIVLVSKDWGSISKYC